MIGLLLIPAAFAQELRLELNRERGASIGTCTDLTVLEGDAAPIDCTLGERFESEYAYRWQSSDAAALRLLSSTAARLPIFSAPAEVARTTRYAYIVYVESKREGVVGQAELSVVVHPALPDDCVRVGDTPLKGEARRRCEKVGALTNLGAAVLPRGDGALGEQTRGPLQEVQAQRRPRPWEEDAVPYLRCPLSVTVIGGAEKAIACTSARSAGGLLEYTAEFDWPPYRHTLIMEGGEFEFTVQAPEISAAAEMQSLILTATDPATGRSATASVQVHVINAAPALSCPDLAVREGESVTFACTAASKNGRNITLQYIPQTTLQEVPRGVFDQSPSFVAPQVLGDTTLIVLVRAIDSEAHRLTEHAFSFTIRDTGAEADHAAPEDPLLANACDRLARAHPGTEPDCTATGDKDSVRPWIGKSDSGRDVIILPPDEIRAPTPASSPQISNAGGQRILYLPNLVTETTSEREAVATPTIVAGTDLSQKILCVNSNEHPYYEAADAGEESQFECYETSFDASAVNVAWELMDPAVANDDVCPELTPHGSTSPREFFEFTVPEYWTGDKVCEYRIQASYNGVTWREKLSLSLDNELGMDCNAPDEVKEEESAAFSCTILREPPEKDYEWTPTSDLDLAMRDRGITADFTFTAPIVQTDTKFPYNIRADRADIAYFAGEAMGEITVLNKPPIDADCTASPTEVIEGGTATISCSATGAPGANPTYQFEWTASKPASACNRLSGGCGPGGRSKTFTAPGNVDGDTDYVYEIKVSADGADPASERVDITVQKALTLTCGGPYEVYEDAQSIQLNCEGDGGPAGAAIQYTWVPSTYLSASNIEDPTFLVPEVNNDITFTYDVTLSAGSTAEVSDQVSVTVRNRLPIDPNCSAVPSRIGEGGAISTLSCSPSGAPGTNPVYHFNWQADGAACNRLSGGCDGDVGSKTFTSPDDVDTETSFAYNVTVSANGAEEAPNQIAVTVQDIPLTLTCTDPDPVYEDAPNFILNCTPGGMNPGATPVYSWSPAEHLSDPTLEDPTFQVPQVDGDTPIQFPYRVELTAGPESVSDNVTVTILNRPSVLVSCSATPSSVPEGGTAVSTLSCSASGVPGTNPDYDFVWTAVDPASGCAMLSGGCGGDTESKIFTAPAEVIGLSPYTYNVKVSALNAIDGTVDVTVNVLDSPLTLTCTDPDPVYDDVQEVQLDCTGGDWNTGETPTYAWTPSTHLDDPALEDPTFQVPNVDRREDFRYTITLTAGDQAPVTDQVTVTILNKPSVLVSCSATPSSVPEGGTAVSTLSCSASGVPGTNPDYDFVWTAVDPASGCAMLSGGCGGDTESKIFTAPAEVIGLSPYTYNVKVSALNAIDGTVDVTVNVLDSPLTLTCTDPDPVYDDVQEVQLDCTGGDWNTGETPTYAWTPSTHLDDPALEDPTFQVPNVDRREDFRYTITLTAGDQAPVTDQVTVTILNKPSVLVSCSATPSSVPEGGTAVSTLSCSASGVPGTNPDYNFEWTAVDPASGCAMLSGGCGGDTESKTFTAPAEVIGLSPYTYNVKVSALNAIDGTVDVTVNVLDSPLTLTCTDPDPVYDDVKEVQLDCTGGDWNTGETPTYAWTPSTHLDDPALEDPTFQVPNVDGREDFRYTITLSAGDQAPVTDQVTVSVLDPESLFVNCKADPAGLSEGSTATSTLTCSASGAPGDSPDYDFVWTAVDPASGCAMLSGGCGGDTESKIFTAPAEVIGLSPYTYNVKVSALNATDGTVDVTVNVLDSPLTLTCTDPDPVYEDVQEVQLDCTGGGWNTGETPTYAWTPSTHLDDPALEDPTFQVPNVDGREDFRYTITLSAGDQAPVTYQVTVSVLDLESLFVNCKADPAELSEGSTATSTLTCSASGAPGDSPDYDFEWTAVGPASGCAMLSSGCGGDTESKTFTAPAEVLGHTAYTYHVTVSADGATDGTVDVTVNVLDSPLTLTCTDPDPVYDDVQEVQLDCTGGGWNTGETPTYAWTPSTHLDDPALEDPTFQVPNVDGREDFRYTIALSAGDQAPVTDQVTVTVLDPESLFVNCEADPAGLSEGSTATSTLTCSASGAPGDNPDYDFEWTAVQPASACNRLSGGCGPGAESKTFTAPAEVIGHTAYTYHVTVSADGATDGTDDVTVNMLDSPLTLTCTDPDPVYDDVQEVQLDCTGGGWNTGETPTYAWTPSTHLDDPALEDPTFQVPNVDGREDFRYTITLTAGDQAPVTDQVTVTVLDPESLFVNCEADPAGLSEGSTAASTLTCSASGAPGDNPEYDFEWTAVEPASACDRLSGGCGPGSSSKTFTAPDKVDADTRYRYSVTATAQSASGGTAEVTVKVLDSPMTLVCADPDPVYEDVSTVPLHCAGDGWGVAETPTYAWSPATHLSGPGESSPIFEVPEVEADTLFEYSVTLSAGNRAPVSDRVSVTVLDRGSLIVSCQADPSELQEGKSAVLSCSASGAPGGNPEYSFEWTAVQPASACDQLSGRCGGGLPSKTFTAPDNVDADTPFTFAVTVTAPGATPSPAEVTITVLNSLSLACTDPDPVYEDAPDIRLRCSGSGWSEGEDPDILWSPSIHLSDVTLFEPTFQVPDVDGDTRFDYTVTLSAGNRGQVVDRVSVIVLERLPLALACSAEPAAINEGSPTTSTLSCSASGAPGGSPEYQYEWMPAEPASACEQLLGGCAANTESQTFTVPGDVDADTPYTFAVTARAQGASEGTARVSVTVLNSLTLACNDPDPVYEDAEDFQLDCAGGGWSDGETPQYTWSPATHLSDPATESPFFEVPEIDANTSIEYSVTLSAGERDPVSSTVGVTLLNLLVLDLACTADPPMVVEGATATSALSCSASGAPGTAPLYHYEWTAAAPSSACDQLEGGCDGSASTRTFSAPENVDADTPYTYSIAVSAEGAETASGEVTVTVQNTLSLVCSDPDPVYEDAPDFQLACTGSGWGDGESPEYVWSPSTYLSNPGIAQPIFEVPAVDADATFEYSVTLSAASREAVSAGITVAVLNRPPLAGSLTGLTVSTSSMHLGTQATGQTVTLDPATGQISTDITGSAYAGRMVLTAADTVNLEIEVRNSAPLVYTGEVAMGAHTISVTPDVSISESCELLSSVTMAGSVTQAQLLDGDCFMLRFGGQVDLAGALAGTYAGSIVVLLREGPVEEMYEVAVQLSVEDVKRPVTVGPDGARFATASDASAGLSRTQAMSIYPRSVILSSEHSQGIFELSNPSIIPLEVSISTEFGYGEAPIEANTRIAMGRIMTDTTGSGLGDLSEHLSVHPSVLYLDPGESKEVRFEVREGALEDKGYAALFNFVSEPRQYVDAQLEAESIDAARTARVRTRIYGVFVPEGGSSQIFVRPVAVSDVAGADRSVTLLLETKDHPFAGEVVLYAGDAEIGRAGALVFTRSQIRVPVSALPAERLFVRFEPHNGGGIPPTQSLVLSP